MTVTFQTALDGSVVIESRESFLESIPLPFASVALSDSYHQALLRNLGVDAGLVVFSRPSDSYYLSSQVGFPQVTPAEENEIASFCRLVAQDVIKFNGNVLRLGSVVSRLPRIHALAQAHDFGYMRLYQINDFLAETGFWLMFFKGLPAANTAGTLINRSLASPQFLETVHDLLPGGRDEDLDAIVNNWVRLLDRRDKETEAHTRRVAQLAAKLAEKFGLAGEILDNFTRGALLHDVGKILVPDEILYKPGALTEAEWQVMKLHPKIVLDLLKGFNVPDGVFEIPCCHHEKWDGSGYPYGLSGEEIPLSARIFSVVDVWDAMLVDRPYRKRFEQAAVIDYIDQQRGRHFDPKVAEVFLELVSTI